MTRTEYEDRIATLVKSAGLFVESEPPVQGKTPDILVKSPDGMECIIECTTLSPSRVCQHGKHVFGLDDPNSLNARLYEKIQEKLKNYAKDIIGNRSLVIAVQNACCSFYDSSAMEVALGAWRYGSSEWKNLWEGTEDAFGLFGKYGHCSGILHSTWSDHLFIPNPGARLQADRDVFHFASVAEPVFQPSGMIKASPPINPPKDAVVTKIRGATIHGLPPDSILVDSVVEVIGEEDGVPQVAIHIKLPSSSTC